MNNSRRVGHIQHIGDLRSEIKQLVKRNRLSLDAVLQRAAFEVLHDNEVPVISFTDVINRADVGMV